MDKSREICRLIIENIPNYVQLCEEGLNNESWLRFVMVIESKDKYLKTLAASGKRRQRKCPKHFA